MIVHVVLRNGVVAQFETNSLEIKVNKDGDPVINASKKEGGISHMFSRPSQIDMILRDTSPAPADADTSNETADNN